MFLFYEILFNEQIRESTKKVWSDSRKALRVGKIIKLTI